MKVNRDGRRGKTVEEGGGPRIELRQDAVQHEL